MSEKPPKLDEESSKLLCDNGYCNIEVSGISFGSEDVFNVCLADGRLMTVRVIRALDNKANNRQKLFIAENGLRRAERT